MQGTHLLTSLAVVACALLGAVACEPPEGEEEACLLDKTAVFHLSVEGGLIPASDRVLVVQGNSADGGATENNADQANEAALRLEAQALEAEKPSLVLNAYAMEDYSCDGHIITRTTPGTLVASYEIAEGRLYELSIQLPSPVGDDSERRFVVVAFRDDNGNGELDDAESFVRADATDGQALSLVLDDLGCPVRL